MAPTIFSPGQDAELEEITVGRRLQIYNPPSVIFFDDSSARNFSEQSLKAEVREKGAACHTESGKIPAQDFHRSAGCFVLIHVERSMIVSSNFQSIHNNRITPTSRTDLATNPMVPDWPLQIGGSRIDTYRHFI
jgi:hypothetical protein